MSKRKTTMVIPTNKRIYYLELTSFVNSFMASVEWSYHDEIYVPEQAKKVCLERSGKSND